MLQIFFLKDSNGLFLAFLIIIGLVSGIVLENFGSRVEVAIYDKWQRNRIPNYDTIWKKFLKLRYDGEEPIGHRYLRNILFRMKFELSTGVGLIFMTMGLGIYDWRYGIFKSLILNIFLVYVLPIISSAYLLLYEGWSSSKILADTRTLLIRKYYK